MLIQALAILATALFTGAALYVSAVEQPARLTLPSEIAIAEWRPSYKRASVMQATLAMLGTLLGIAAGLFTGGAIWIVAAFLLSAVVPFTLFVMWPTNTRLKDPALDLSSAAARELLVRWGRLHAVRTAISLAALLLMLLARS
jgi:anthrone oxygenase-like protein